ncbi:MAG: glycosyltransferase [Victivallales bacterium]
MKKILFVHHTPEFVGSARSLFYLLKELDRIKYDPVVSLVYDGPVRKKYEDLGIKVYHVPFTPIWEAPSPYWYNIKNKLMNWFAFLPNRRFGKFLDTIKPDIVHLNDTACLSAGIAANRCGIPVVTHVRSVHRLKPALLQMRSMLLVKAIEKISSRIIAIGEEYAIQFGNSKKVEVVYNSLDFPAIEKAVGTGVKFRDEYKLGKEDILIGMVGTLTRHKGAWDFIKACGMAHRNSTDSKLRFIIVGNIPGENILNRFKKNTGIIGLRHPYEHALKLAESNGIADRLFIVGHRQDIYSVMDAFDVVVFPTRLDATGRPILEAAAMGKPSIASVPTKDTKVLIDGVTGLIVPPENPRALADAIVKLAENQELRGSMGKAGFELSRKNFDPRINIGKVQKIYEEVLEFENAKVQI